LLPWADQGRES